MLHRQHAVARVYLLDLVERNRQLQVVGAKLQNIGLEPRLSPRRLSFVTNLALRLSAHISFAASRADRPRSITCTRCLIPTGFSSLHRRTNVSCRAAMNSRGTTRPSAWTDDARVDSGNFNMRLKQGRFRQFAASGDNHDRRGCSACGAGCSLFADRASSTRRVPRRSSSPLRVSDATFETFAPYSTEKFAARAQRRPRCARETTSRSSATSFSAVRVISQRDAEIQRIGKENLCVVVPLWLIYSAFSTGSVASCA